MTENMESLQTSLCCRINQKLARDKLQSYVKVRLNILAAAWKRSSLGWSLFLKQGKWSMSQVPCWLVTFSHLYYGDWLWFVAWKNTAQPSILSIDTYRWADRLNQHNCTFQVQLNHAVTNPRQILHRISGATERECCHGAPGVGWGGGIPIWEFFNTNRSPLWNQSTGPPFFSSFLHANSCSWYIIHLFSFLAIKKGIFC